MQSTSNMQSLLKQWMLVIKAKNIFIGKEFIFQSIVVLANIPILKRLLILFFFFELTQEENLMAAVYRRNHSKPSLKIVLLKGLENLKEEMLVVKFVFRVCLI